MCGLPSCRGVLKLGPNDSFISHLTYARMSSFYIPFQETKIFLCISSDSVDMVTEAQIRGYVATQIPGLLNRIKGLSMHGVFVPDRAMRSGYMQDLTLGWIKLHVPLFLPLLKQIQIILKLFRVVRALQCHLQTNRPVTVSFPAGRLYTVKTGWDPELTPGELPKEQAVHPSAPH